MPRLVIDMAIIDMMISRPDDGSGTAATSLPKSSP